MSSGSIFYQAKARVEKALTPVETKQIFHGLGINYQVLILRLGRGSPFNMTVLGHIRF